MNEKVRSVHIEGNNSIVPKFRSESKKIAATWINVKNVPIIKKVEVNGGLVMFSSMDILNNIHSASDKPI